jgi:hypothetical protein
VVDVAAEVVAHGRLLVLRQDLEGGEDVVRGAVLPLGARERVVRVRDVGLVVFVVVEPHRFLVDVRLERVVRVRQIRKFKGQFCLPSLGLP